MAIDRDVSADDNNPFAVSPEAGATRATSIENETKPHATRSVKRLWRLWIVVLALPAAIWFLIALASAPYRPPEDMSSLLGAGEPELVYSLAILLLIFWTIASARLFTLLVKAR